MDLWIYCLVAEINLCLCVLLTRVSQSVMETIKKKLAALKDEKEAAIERAEEAEQLRKESEAKCEQVSCR